MLLAFGVMLFAAVAPAAWLMRKVYELDRMEKEPRPLLLRLVLWGMVSTLPALLLESVVGSLLDKLFGGAGLLYVVLESLLGVALIEEGCKYYFLRRTVWRSPAFNCRFDGVVYAVFVSLGFALIENINYIFSFGLQVALSRAVLAVPMHAVCGVYMGIWLGEAKRSAANAGRMRYCLAKSLWLPMLMHAVYDGCLLHNSRLSVTIFAAFVLAVFIGTWQRVRRFAREDMYIAS